MATAMGLLRRLFHEPCDEVLVDMAFDDRGIWLSYECAVCRTVRKYYLLGERRGETKVENK